VTASLEFEEPAAPVAEGLAVEGLSFAPKSWVFEVILIF
jgi:hypothetical protein